MTIEEKAKRYDNAIELAKSWYIDAELGFKKSLENLFPELKESEDEMILRVLREGFNTLAKDDEWYNGITNGQILAWLEKQGKQGDSDVKDYNSIDPHFGKPIDKVEPRFHEGDWICHDTFHINKIENCTYISDEGATISFGRQNDWRLWTLREAKDGDVLATSAGAFIYNGNNGGGGCPGSYCGINTLGRFQTGVEHHWTGKKVYPATKEERDTLFKAMADAGYEWDAEKKELEELGQSEVTKESCQEEGLIEIPFGAKDSELQEVIYNIPKGFHAEIKGDSVLIKKGEQKLTWSEEDERYLKAALFLLKNSRDTYLGIKGSDMFDWLKSIKNRIKE